VATRHQAIAAQCEADTTTIQQDVVDPNADLTEPEQAAQKLRETRICHYAKAVRRACKHKMNTTNLIAAHAAIHWAGKPNDIGEAACADSWGVLA
jgi:GH24 family phage-related lysozyme (muramidase)